VRGDRVALEVIVRNLLENALKFTPRGSVRLEVSTVRGLARLTMTDTGPGIPEAMLEQVFERFHQADVIHRRGGSGLGLAIARSFARWHGGEITAHNNQSGGASFTLELPILEIQAS
jgi:two-component system, OmpR family, sensor kinase